MSSPLDILSRRLLPWLEPPFRKLEAARLAGRLGHGWLIAGPAGVGKLNLALALAQRLFGGELERDALDPGAALAAMAARYEPQDRHPDLHWLYPSERKQEDEEKEKASVSIDQVRAATDALTLTAHRSGAKVLVIESAELLSRGAANALLKTLEEPTPNSYVLLLSQQPGSLPPTVRSRCQRLVLPTPDDDAVAAWLAVSPTVVREARYAVGDAPLQIAAGIRGELLTKFSKLESDLTAISEDRLDPLSIVQSWIKGETKAETRAETELALSWLQRRLHGALRARLAESGGSTSVTVPAAATLHNAWRALPARALFDEYDRAEKLLNLLGSGLNIELALAAMLNALVVNRGRS